MTKEGPTKVVAAATAYAEAADCDVLLVNSGFEVDTDAQVLEVIKGRKRRKNVMLLLVTEGGSADAAYKVVRFLQKNYTSITGFVHGYCKSAGTLCLLGVHQMVMSDSAELGPLDVQLTKRDELGQRSSGLVAAEALASLEARAFEMYEDYFLQILSRSGYTITFRTASDIAGRITVGLFEPLYAQINPVEVGEMARSMRVANDYGKRLGAFSGNLRPQALELLCETYPSHGFVIDDQEATSIFKNLRAPTDAEIEIATLLGKIATTPQAKPLIFFLNEELKEQLDVNQSDTAGSPDTADEGQGEPDDPGSAEGATGANEAAEHSEPKGDTETPTSGEAGAGGNLKE